ncbi:hypothetical protein FX988_02264 [Paraglaciecola mesophila]|uniref:DUF3300 domain-containing protein n=1 Tax=Paraglaciecola mesophila TaxID=197222 RepID=A0A857JL15_9ALTE|nr:DUF3300 domain-containing protein [Paraglaciecola mesophila]QHJ12022.1 hypothetical protein FX988_02264 [Paraglaciecola mesophila]
MGKTTKYLIIYVSIILLLIGTAIELAHAETQDEPPVELHQAKLDQMLAPIALYPDALLSHILIAATYPLEVVQAARWRDEHANLSEQQALDLAEQQDWDPSVIALTPFKELLERMSKDLNWLQDLGDAFLANEAQVLDSVQTLRSRAYAKGNLHDNPYQSVEREQEKIVIHSVERETVYVPFYDTRVVYGDWWWTVHQPIYWRSPRHYTYHSGFHWSPRFHISAGFFFGGFHWRNNHVVINNDYRYRRSNHRYIYNKVRQYPRWQHNRHHRRTVKYHNGYKNKHKRTIVSRNYESQNQGRQQKQVLSRLKHKEIQSNRGVYNTKRNVQHKSERFDKKATSTSRRSINTGQHKVKTDRISKHQRASRGDTNHNRLNTPYKAVKQAPAKHARSQQARNQQVLNQQANVHKKVHKKVQRMSSSKQQHRAQSSMRKHASRAANSNSGKFKARRVEP